MASRSYVLASLRALHLDPIPPPATTRRPRRQGHTPLTLGSSRPARPPTSPGAIRRALTHTPTRLTKPQRTRPPSGLPLDNPAPFRNDRPPATQNARARLDALRL